MKLKSMLFGGVAAVAMTLGVQSTAHAYMTILVTCIDKNNYNYLWSSKSIFRAQFQADLDRCRRDGGLAEVDYL
ncbi:MULTISPECIES: hypothetical protein [Pseudoalteromonas]|uniref:Uncharacterized protein n=3 Tax=Pseudoalteromonas luteoviolacea TaxID=43657 RepID=A0A0F6A9W0_9GAMM|nr:MULTISPECIES: hypothetical protein [Pseudoalteromonas]AOT08772.1 hypothetical protein S4054249_13320 [Pseudoalteromonas luteoviolacea]AOT13686.1 hypothetical protein S40542_13290 [Pseudoalteromonas luteoviolacea]AOT18600.1 hypothetical protein S4054_13295 [Pseudoalteromonas luteoviolacea]KID58854.1 hypothetical protein JF50_03115 [Pseudoalteromonas luteoviolacea]KKE82918.1 hypothetical protein N479_16030 [Pseudoalteromonas luteoviolacea S4054]